MPSPWSLITAYPPTELDTYIKDHHETVYIYVDLKNILVGLWVENICNEIILNTDNYGTVDSSIFQSVIAYSSYWKKWCRDRGKSCKIFVCTDTGRSQYHTSIYKKYKYRRYISNVQGGGITSGIMDDRVKVIRDKNFAICENAINKIPGLHFFNLKFLEADFLLHYLRYHKCDHDNTFHIFTSCDKDMYQSMLGDDIVMLYKNRGIKYVYDESGAMGKYCDIKKKSVKVQQKLGEQIRNVDSKYIPAMMAMVGDDGDDVPGIKGIGPSGSMDIISDSNAIKMIGTPEELDDRIFHGGKFFLEDVVPLKHMSKKLQKCFLENDKVTQAYKLISYSQLIRWMETPDMTEKKDWILYINKILNKEGVPILPSSGSLLAGLNKLSDNYLNEEVLLPFFD